jgi:signal transduction histidine kinase
LTPFSNQLRNFQGSLRLRLLAGALVWVSVALAVIAVLLVHLFRYYAEDDFYGDLISDQQEVVAALSRGQDGQLQAAPTISEPQFGRPYSGLYWQVNGLAGALLRSASLQDFTLFLPVDRLAPGEEHRHRLVGPERQSLLAVERSVVLPDYPEPVRVVVADDARALDASVKGFSLRLALSFVALGAALIIAGALQVWAGLRPLQRLREHLRRVREGEERRLEGAYPQEVQPLIDDLNTLLDRQAEVVERARVMTGNLAHGLKTPLAVIANEASRLYLEGGSGPAALIQAQVARMQRQIDYHTARARAAAARSVPGVRCFVAPSTRSLLRVVERLHPERRLGLEAALADDLVFLGERQDFEEMLGNLLDNAAKWAAARILVNGHRLQTGWIEVVVQDDGPGLPADQVDQAFRRGERLDEAVPGSGLGLAIVRDLAEMYGGGVNLGESSLGGLSARLRLPGM